MPEEIIQSSPIETIGEIFTVGHFVAAIIVVAMAWLLLKLLSLLSRWAARRFSRYRMQITGLYPVARLVVWIFATYLVIVDVFQPPTNSLLALLASPVAKEVGPRLARAENELADLMERIGFADSPEDERGVLAELTAFRRTATASTRGGPVQLQHHVFPIPALPDGEAVWGGPLLPIRLTRGTVATGRVRSADCRGPPN